MDLLGDIGTADQLTSTRAENAVLQAKVKELSLKVKVLTVENEALKAEVEIYRQEAAQQPRVPSTTTEGLSRDLSEDDVQDDFVRSGNGVYPSAPAATLPKLHELSNPLCCALSSDDSILLTGGADSHVSLCQWGAYSESSESDNYKARLRCHAPVISVAHCWQHPLVAVGCMDGMVQLLTYSTRGGALHAELLNYLPELKHGKYVKTLVWARHQPLLATASADGTVQVHKITKNLFEEERPFQLETLETLHLSGPVEALCFFNEQLCCHARGNPHISLFDLGGDWKQTKINLNGETTGGFDQHVSFTVMHMVPSPPHATTHKSKYLALATDMSRNIVLDVENKRLVRNLYGHQNDGFSQPKLAWSTSGDYIFGNTQEGGALCVWDIASAKIVKRLEGHGQSIRDLYSSPSTQTLVTTCFDKQTKIWLTE